MMTARDAITERDKIDDERTLHARMRWFGEKWTDRLGPREAAEFHADLVMVIQAVHRDANRETHALLAKALAAVPSMTFVTKTE